MTNSDKRYCELCATLSGQLVEIVEDDKGRMCCPSSNAHNNSFYYATPRGLALAMKIKVEELDSIIAGYEKKRVRCQTVLLALEDEC